MLENLFLVLIAICLICLFFFLLFLPVKIARRRGVSDSDLSIIQTLCWVSILLGFTWFIALILSLVYKTKVAVESSNPSACLDALEKLHTLKEKGIISPEAYESGKAKILQDL